MSIVPAEIAGIGPSAMKPRVSPGFDPLKAQVGPDEYFVLSRIDGTQTIREILLSTGLPIERGIAIVTKLRSIGALLLPGESAAPAPASPPSLPRPHSTTPVAPLTPPRGVATLSELGRAPTLQISPPDSVREPGPAISRTPSPARPRVPMPAQAGSHASGRTQSPSSPPATRTPSSSSPPAVARTPSPSGPPAVARTPSPSGPPAVARTATPLTPMPSMRVPARSQGGTSAALPDLTAAEQAALLEPCDLATDERAHLLAMARLVAARDPWALLGVPAGSDVKALKRAYFKLSKQVHPDRYYGRQLGSFADRLSVIFEAVSRAYAKLTTPDKGRATGGMRAVTAEQPQTPQEYAAELFERACALEVGGVPLDAMKLFAAAVRIDPHTRYLRRAATCALAAGQPKSALEYAKKAQTQAPSDPSAARLLASAFRATGKLADAEEVLVMAMALKSENDVLDGELRNDLAEVRRLMSS